jgi:hypothetical protein
MKKCLVCSFLISILFVMGCSVYMAAKQPDKKDVNLFRIGTPRSMILANLACLWHLK